MQMMRDHGHRPGRSREGVRQSTVNQSQANDRGPCASRRNRSTTTRPMGAGSTAAILLPDSNLVQMPTTVTQYEGEYRPSGPNTTSVTRFPMWFSPVLLSI